MKHMGKVKIYLACPWDSRELAKEAAEKFEAAGFEITHDWWNYDNISTGDLEKHEEYANEDFRAVQNCDILFLMNLQERGKETSGKAVETGIALALHKRIIGMGIRYTNIFQYLKEVEWVESVDEAIGRLND